MEQQNDLEKYGTVASWSKELGISQSTIALRLKETEGIQGKDYTSGNIALFYPETSVRAALGELLKDLPYADADGFFKLDSVRYATLEGWQRTLGIGKRKLSVALHPSKGKKGKTANGRIRIFYPESDESGFFEQNGIRYGTIGALSKTWKINYSTLTNRCARLQGKTGRSPTGQLLIGKFFKESDVQACCKDLIPGDF